MVRARDIRTRFAELAEKCAVPGAQLVVVHDGDQLDVQHGVVTHGTGRPVTEQTKFPLGSVTKVATATLAMVLVADDDLDVDVPVGRYLPELRPSAPEVATKVTLRHVLSHTAGLASECDDFIPRAASRLRYVIGGCRPGLMYSPGAGFSYSNTGYVLAGLLIEAATDLTWWDALDAILLRPLGQVPSFLTGAEGGPTGAPFASGHLVSMATGRIRRLGDQTLPPALAPAGALAASAGDLATFGRLLSGDRTLLGRLGDPCLNRMTEQQPAADPFGIADGWGLGVAFYRSASGSWWGHDGNGDGTSAHLRVDRSRGTVVAMTANANTGLRLWDDVVTELRGLGLEVGNHAGVDEGQSSVPSADCLGRYVNGDTAYDVVRDGDGNVCLTIGRQPGFRLRCHEDLTFAAEDLTSGNNTYPGRFLRDGRTGQVDRVQVNGRTAMRQE